MANFVPGNESQLSKVEAPDEFDHNHICDAPQQVEDETERGKFVKTPPKIPLFAESLNISAVPPPPPNVSQSTSSIELNAIPPFSTDPPTNSIVAPAFFGKSELNQAMISSTSSQNEEKPQLPSSLDNIVQNISKLQNLLPLKNGSTTETQAVERSPQPVPPVQQTTPIRATGLLATPALPHVQVSQPVPTTCTIVQSHTLTINQHQMGQQLPRRPDTCLPPTISNAPAGLAPPPMSAVPPGLAPRMGLQQAQLFSPMHMMPPVCGSQFPSTHIQRMPFDMLDRNGRSICRFFLRGGTCRRGTACKFSHDLPYNPGQAAPVQQQAAPLNSNDRDLYQQQMAAAEQQMNTNERVTDNRDRPRNDRYDRRREDRKGRERRDDSYRRRSPSLSPIRRRRRVRSRTRSRSPKPRRSREKDNGWPRKERRWTSKSNSDEDKSCSPKRKYSKSPSPPKRRAHADENPDRMLKDIADISDEELAIGEAIGDDSKCSVDSSTPERE